MSHRHLPALLLTACTSSADHPGSVGRDDGPNLDIPNPEEDGGYLADVEDRPLPALDGPSVSATIEDLLPALLQMHAGEIQDVYEELLTGASPGCPTWNTSPEGLPYWFDSCTSDGGSSFDGYAYDVDVVDRPDGDVVWSGWQFYGLTTIETPDGRRFESTGAAGLLTGTQADGAQVSYSYMDEGFRYTGDAHGAAWLSTEGSPQVAAYAVHQPSTGGRLVALEARVALTEGDFQAAVFEDIQLGDSEIGAPCTREPAGLVSLRTLEGTWLTLYFEGPPVERWGDGIEDPDSCDGCASVWTSGTRLGEVCVDTSSLLAWEGSPWETAAGP